VLDIGLNKERKRNNPRIVEEDFGIIIVFDFIKEFEDNF
jgi:hypothetical protein